MRMHDAVTEFLYAHDYSAKSRDWYGQMLGLFANHLTTSGVDDTTAVTNAHVRVFLDAVRARTNPQAKRPVSTQTVHAYARAVRAFLHWAVEEELVDAAVARRMKMPKVESATVIPAFTPDQLQRLMRAAEATPTPLRDRALLAVLLDTGIRANEACTLTLGHAHFDPDGAWLFVHGKRDKWREVGLGQKSRNLLHRYVHRERGLSVPWPNVFLGKRGPLTPSGLDQLIYRLEEAAGPQHFRGVRASAHTFRHTFAQSYLANGGDVYKLSRLLGHESVSITEVYLRSMSSRIARQGQSVFDSL